MKPLIAFLSALCLHFSYLPTARARCAGSVLAPEKPEEKKEEAAAAAEETPGAPETPEGENNPPGDPAPPASRTTNIFSRAGDFLRSQSSLVGDLAAVRAQLATANATIAAQNTELLELRNGRDQLDATIRQLESERTTVSQSVANTLSELGVPQGQLPASESAAGGTSDAALYDQYKPLKGKERTKFLRQHKEALQRHEAALQAAKK